MSRLNTMARFAEPDEIPNEIPAFYCDNCGDDIYSGQGYYDADGDTLCCRCGDDEDESQVYKVA